MYFYIQCGRAGVSGQPVASPVMEVSVIGKEYVYMEIHVTGQILRQRNVVRYHVRHQP